MLTKIRDDILILEERCLMFDNLIPNLIPDWYRRRQVKELDVAIKNCRKDMSSAFSENSAGGYARYKKVKTLKDRYQLQRDNHSRKLNPSPSRSAVSARTR